MKSNLAICFLFFLWSHIQEIITKSSVMKISPMFSSEFYSWELPSGLVFRILLFHCCGPVQFLVRELEILQAT